LLAVAGL